MPNKWTMTPLFPKIPDPTIIEADKILRPYYEWFSRVIMVPWQDFQDRRATDRWFQGYSEPQAAGLMHTHVTNYAAESISDLESGTLRIDTVFGKPVYVVPERLAITIKKLRRADNEDDMYRSNYLTRRNTDYWDQRRMEGHLDVPRIIIGYVFLEAITRLEIVVAYPRTRGLEVRWFYEMPAIVQAPKIAQPPEPAQDDPEKEFNVVPKEGIILPDDADVEGA
jgi:hypothetical protein